MYAELFPNVSSVKAEKNFFIKIQDLPSAIGLSNIFRAALTVVSLGAGALQETTGTVAASLYFLSGLGAACMVAWLLADAALSRRSSRPDTVSAT